MEKVLTARIYPATTRTCERRVHLDVEVASFAVDLLTDAFGSANLYLQHRFTFQEAMRLDLQKARLLQSKGQFNVYSTVYVCRACLLQLCEQTQLGSLMSMYLDLLDVAPTTYLFLFSQLSKESRLGGVFSGDPSLERIHKVLHSREWSGGVHFVKKSALE